MPIAIIPARGGSKRIPRKNVKPFHGKPMVAWPILTARETGLFDRIIVTTDDPEIADIAQEFGAICPFQRPDHLSDDHTGIQPVIKHAITTLSINPDEDICVILPTSPLLLASDLQDAHKRLNEQSVHFVVSTASFPYPAQRAMIRDGSGILEFLYNQNALTRSQDLPETFHDAGQFYWGKARHWVDTVNILASHSVGYTLPRSRVQDIDTPEDWAFTEILFDVNKNKQT